MSVICFGSLNIDYAYSVDHIVIPGETISSYDREVFAGGKGLNQSIALARAGAVVSHAGIIGEGGAFLKDMLVENGVDASLLKESSEMNGHTFIQVDKNGQNSIVLYGGTNQMISQDYIDTVLSYFGKGDVILLQNEVNMLKEIIEGAYERNVYIVLNPSPFDHKILECDLNKVDLFVLNEIEGSQISGADSNDPRGILDRLRESFPKTDVLLTLGKRGSYYMSAQTGERFFQDIVSCKEVDTTAAGDTYTGYFLNGLINGDDISVCMKKAATASSITVSRPGAAPSIPCFSEVEELL